MNGKVIWFKSYNEDGFWLYMDAVQACKEAGIYLRDGDADKMTVDGRKPNW